MKLSSTSRQVLHNLLVGKPMWMGCREIVPGGGIPAVRASLLKKGLIDRSDRLTTLGQAAAERKEQ